MSNQMNRANTPSGASLENYPSFKKENQASSVYRHRYLGGSSDRNMTVKESSSLLSDVRGFQQDKASAVLRQRTEYKMVPDDTKPDFQDFVATNEKSLGRQQAH